MRRSTEKPTIVRVSRTGRVGIPEPLREQFGIETPGEVFVYEEDDRIVVEPIPSIEELEGTHADEDRDDGEILERACGRKVDEKRREKERATRLRPADSSDEAED